MSFRILEDPMLETIVIAAALFVCPGDVYSDTPHAGCHPLQDSNRKASARLRKRRNSTRKCRRTLQNDTGRASKNSQSRLPAASEQECAMYEEWVKLSTKSSSIRARDLSQESSNGGRISSRSSGTVRLPTVGNHPLPSRGLDHFLSHPAEPFFIRFPLEHASSYNPSLNSIAISKPSNRTASDLEQCMSANQLNNPGLG